MILDIDNISLEMVRGDTFTLPLELNCGTREKFVHHTLSGNECLFVGIMRPNQSFENADIRCMITSSSEKDSNGNSVIKLNPSHTVNMYPGKYYITIKFVKDDFVQTLIDSKLFFITGSNPC